MILLTTTLSLRAKREGSYVHGAPSAQAVFDRDCAVNQAVRAYGQVVHFRRVDVHPVPTSSHSRLAE